jgi:cytochrome c oxidase assembly protein subunit 15
LVFAAACLTFLVVVAGAYVRLQDAGLGCPDWPGCYGHLVGVPQGAQEITRAEQGFPQRAVEAHKAWKEMFHRYIAGTLGVLLFATMITAWRRRRAVAQSPWLPTAIVALVAVQATLGIWTVTMLLKPVIVTLHLLGGMGTLALTCWLALRQPVWPQLPPDAPRGLSAHGGEIGLIARAPGQFGRGQRGADFAAAGRRCA